MLTPYAKWSPTIVDRRGLKLPDRQDWLVLPITHNRDTEDEPLAKSNWEYTLASLAAADEYQDTWEERTFRHWACGWFTIIMVKPGTDAHTVGQALSDSLPVLDEDRYGELEYEAAVDYWSDEGETDFLRDQGLCDDAIDAVQAYPDNDLWSQVYYEHDGRSISYRFQDSRDSQGRFTALLYAAWAYHLENQTD